MADTSPVTVTCPCCNSRLTIDPVLMAVLHHEPPPKSSPVTDLTEAAKALKAEDSKREARFKESLEAQKDKGKILDKKFHEALKKAKDEPVTPETRDIDLD